MVVTIKDGRLRTDQREAFGLMTQMAGQFECN
jgi:hypothetical protein